MANPLEVTPRFLQLHFTRPGQANPQVTFPAGIKEIYAVWFYENMGPKDVIERTWFKDGVAWLVRQETWESTANNLEGMPGLCYDWRLAKSQWITAGKSTALCQLGGPTQLTGTKGE